MKSKALLRRVNRSLCALPKDILQQFPRNVSKLTISSGGHSYKQKAANLSTKGVGGRPAPFENRQITVE